MNLIIAFFKALGFVVSLVVVSVTLFVLPILMLPFWISIPLLLIVITAFFTAMFYES
jgi:hypothetical protein